MAELPAMRPAVSLRTIRALTILRDHGPLMPRDFAELMWPRGEYPAWQHHAKCGNKGVHQGGGMYLAAGGYLGRLSHRGLVEHRGTTHYGGFRLNDYGITRLGMKVLGEECMP